MIPEGKLTPALQIMKCQPSSKKEAERVTSDLFRLFTQYYFPSKRYGSLKNFVVEFIEGRNGMTYLS